MKTETKLRRRHRRSNRRLVNLMLRLERSDYFGRRISILTRELDDAQATNPQTAEQIERANQEAQIEARARERREQAQEDRRQENILKGGREIQTYEEGSRITEEDYDYNREEFPEIHHPEITDEKGSSETD